MKRRGRGRAKESQRRAGFMQTSLADKSVRGVDGARLPSHKAAPQTNTGASRKRRQSA